MKGRTLYYLQLQKTEGCSAVTHRRLYQGSRNKLEVEEMAY